MPTYVRSGGAWLDVSGGVSVPPSIPSGVSILFYEASAPTGWTKVTTHDNKALRVVSGTGAGSGGSTAFTSVFTSRGVPLPQHAHGGTTGGHSNDHTHTFNNFAPGNGGGFRTGGGNFYNGFNTGTTSGTSSDHTHTFTTSNEGTAGASMDFAVQYIDVILCSKN